MPYYVIYTASINIARNLLPEGVETDSKAVGFDEDELVSR